DYPGERLVVCKNPLLAEERAHKRAELLAATEKDLARIAARVQRARSPLRGAAAIGQAVGAVLGRRHMAKHFQISITDDTFSFAQNPLSIAAEAALDGIYVVRTNLPAEHSAAAARPPADAPTRQMANRSRCTASIRCLAISPRSPAMSSASAAITSPPSSPPLPAHSTAPSICSASRPPRRQTDTTAAKLYQWLALK